MPRTEQPWPLAGQLVKIETPDLMRWPWYRPRAKAVSAALDTIRDSLKRGEKVTITGFGTFETAHRGSSGSTWRLVEA
jgi:hypothetical protein